MSDDIHLSDSPKDAILSGPAIYGVIWASVLLIPWCLCFLCFAVDSYSPWIKIFMLVSFIGYPSIVVTPILGIVSIVQIRKSKGHRYGMKLAIFDALIFPLIVLLILWTR